MWYNKGMKKKIAIFDLDGTVIDSSHRTPNKPDGTLDLEGYFELRTRKNIFKDTLLPLAEKMKEMYASGDYYIVICTAREMCQADYDFLDANSLKYHHILERNTCRKPYHWNLPDAEYKTKQLKPYKYYKYEFYDDAEPIVEAFRSYPNVTMYDAKIENKRMAYAK